MFSALAPRVLHQSASLLWYLNLNSRDDCQVTEKFRGDFATLAGSIVCESEKLITLGDEVAEACTEKTLKKVLTVSYVEHIVTSCLPIQALQQENLPKIEPICKQFKLLMKVMEPSHEEQGKQ